MSQEKNPDLSRDKGAGKYNRRSLAQAVQLLSKGALSQTCQEFLSNSSAIQKLSAWILQKAELAQRKNIGKEPQSLAVNPNLSPVISTQVVPQGGS